MNIASIGIIKTTITDPYALPFQPEVTDSQPAIVELNANCNFEMALEDLKGFSRIWLIFHFHKTSQWRPKVKPPRGNKKRGVFATRSPHRPNAIGMSCVRLLDIRGRKLYIGDHDLIDGTPILDIKPYIPYADSHPESKAGWLDECQLPDRIVQWSKLSEEQANFIRNNNSYDLKALSNTPLQIDPRPKGRNRIEIYHDNLYAFRCKTWSLIFREEDSFQRIFIEHIESAYNQATIDGVEESRWPDVPLHRLFKEKFCRNKPL